MLYHPDYIVYLWLLPVTFMILIPAALVACRFSIGCMKKAPVKREEEYVALNQGLVAEA